jgi:hypothetical protein
MSPHEFAEVFAALTATVTVAWAFVTGVRAVAKRVAGSSAARSSDHHALPPDFAARWERMEQAVDALSIEVERISEAQRFTTKLLSERSANGARLPSPAEPRRHQSPSGGGVPAA